MGNASRVATRVAGFALVTPAVRGLHLRLKPAEGPLGRSTAAERRPGGTDGRVDVAGLAKRPYRRNDRARAAFPREEFRRVESGLLRGRVEAERRLRARHARREVRPDRVLERVVASDARHGEL